MTAEKVTKDWYYRDIGYDDLSSSELREGYTLIGAKARAYCITIVGAAEGAIAIYSPDDGRIGIAWGADAVWYDCTNDIEASIDDWVNGDPDDGPNDQRLGVRQ